MHSAVRLHPAVFYSAYLLLALVWLAFVWFFTANGVLILGNFLVLLLIAVILAGDRWNFIKQLHFLEEANKKLINDEQALRQQLAERMLAVKASREKTNNINQQNTCLRSLHVAALAFMNRLKLEDLLENVVQNAVNLADAADAFISLKDSAGVALITKAGTGCFQKNIGEKVLLTDDIGGRIYKTRHAVVLNELDTDLTSSYICPGFKKAVFMPLSIGDEIIGIIGLGYYNDILLTPAEFEFLEGLAALAASAVDNAVLYEKVHYELNERKLIEDNLTYISIHDPLTGLYNRIYFEEEMRRLCSGRFDPVGIIICDVDGLKLVNDSLGHIPGDELLQTAASVIKTCFRENDVIARIGGDEFAILLPCSDLALVEAAYQRVKSAIVEYNTNSTGLLLSISIGYACKDTADTKLQEVFQLADDAMYRKKMKNRKNTREALIQSIRGLLEVKNFLVTENSERLYNLVIDFAKKVGLANSKLADLSLLVEFHDIGKVGIPDGILAKTQPLTSGEISEIRRHSEIGYRIAKVLPELQPIADSILKHHEWWNGQGYPFGIAGEEIPLECRIWAIADAYDAMTSERPYREALKSQSAISEIIKGAGSQFDPELVKIFVKMIEEQK